MASTISTLAPLAADGIFTSPSVSTSGAGATKLVGTVFADQIGVLEVQQGFDNVNFDATTSFYVAASTGQGFEVDLIAPYFQVVYTNGSTLQTVFRLYADMQNDDGNYVAPQTPSTGGEYVVLIATSNGGYSYVGRFDGNDGWAACSNAATQSGTAGKYAAFDVSTGVVANEALIQTTEASAASF